MYVAEPGIAEPAGQFLDGVVVLILGGEPVERITDTILPMRMGAEIDDLVERLVEDREAPQPGAKPAIALQPLRRRWWDRASY